MIPGKKTVNSMVNLFASQIRGAVPGDMVFTDVEMLFGSAKLLTVDGAHDVKVTGNFSGQAGVRKQGTGTLRFSAPTPLRTDRRSKPAFCEPDPQPHIRVRVGTAKGGRPRTVPLWWDAGTHEDLREGKKGRPGLISR